MRSPTFAIALLVTAAAPRLAQAFPIPPATLWSLTERADVVVLAETKAISERPAAEDDFFGGSSVAELKVLEVWQGDPDLERVEVVFPAGLICPAPPRYVEGEMVLAFLTLSAPETYYRTVSLSYGTLYPHFDELGAWRAAVEEAAALRANGKASEADRRRWLVRRAARAPTRWHGVYLLDPDADRAHRYYDRRPLPEVGLDDDDRALLAAGLVDEPSLDTGLVGVLALLDGYESEDVDRVAIAAVDQLLEAEQRGYLLGALLPLTLRRLGVEPPTSPPLENPSGIDDPFIVGLPPATKAARDAYTAARAGRSSPAVDFRYPRRPRVLGTGATTPL